MVDYWTMTENTLGDLLLGGGLVLNLPPEGLDVFKGASDGRWLMVARSQSDCGKVAVLDCFPREEYITALRCAGALRYLYDAGILDYSELWYVVPLFCDDNDYTDLRHVRVYGL